MIRTSKKHPKSTIATIFYPKRMKLKQIAMKVYSKVNNFEKFKHTYRDVEDENLVNNSDVCHIIGNFSIRRFIFVIVDISEDLSLDSLEQKFRENFSRSDVEGSQTINTETSSDNTQNVVRIDHDNGTDNIDVETVYKNNEAENLQDE